MKRIILVTLASLIVLGAVAGGSLVYGYFAHREQISPVYGLGERIIVRARRDLGMPTETAVKLQQVETTFLTLNGTTYVMPNNDFRTGGAISVWDEDVLMINQHGDIFYLEDGEGLVDTNLPVPQTNRDAYAKLAAEEYPDQFAKVDRLRFMDVEYIDSAAFRGLVVAYTYIDVDNRCYRTRISGLRVPESVSSIRELTATQDDWEVLFETSPCLEFNPTRELIVGYMAGGRVAFKAPDLLYMGSGEYHREGFYRPDSGIQDDDSDYGKTIEINLSTGEARHFSKGHRNLQGVVVDLDGQLWTTEHGMRGGDELNRIVDGQNYGWPLENLGTLYSGIPAPTEGAPGRHIVHEPPVYAWLPSAAVSSLAVVDGFHETWDGDLLIGSLRGKTLFRARIRDERLVFLEPIDIGQRIRDVMQVAPDKLALMLDSNELVIFTIEERKDPLAALVTSLVADGMPQERAEMAHGVIVGCIECHSLSANVHGAGPSLHGLIDRSVASTAFQGYSSALRGLGGVWSKERLAAYLTDPEALAPGTSMTGLGVGDPEIAGDVATAFGWLRVQERQD